MNKGMPNSAKILANSLAVASGVTGPLGWILGMVLRYVFRKGIQKGLVMADQTHVALIVKNESETYVDENDEAYKKKELIIVNEGRELTQEEKDEIDAPVMDAFRKLATYKLRKHK